MTLKQAIDYVGEVKPHAYSEAILTGWINEVEGYIQTDVFLFDTVHNLTQYTWDENQDTELLVKPPHDDLYTKYLEAKIDYQNGEYDKYANSQAAYEDRMTEFKIWFIENYHPAGIGGWR